MSPALRQAVVPAYLFLCLLLGGSTQGIWFNLALQLNGILLLVWAMLAEQRSHVTPPARMLIWLGVAWLALALAQIIPLPPEIWSALPGRQAAVESFTLRGEPLPWLAWSLSPSATAAILPIIAVPLGVIAAMLMLGAFKARWCIAALGLGTTISVLLGALQLAQGGPYLYPISNTGTAAGLFANSNHQATLLLVTIPFLAAVIGRAQRKSRRSDAKARMGRITIALGAFAVVVMGIVLNGSMAALALSGPVILASIGLALPGAARHVRWLGGLALALLMAGAAALAIFTDAGSSSSVTSRSEIYRNTIPAIAETFPVGTGLGTFERVYRLREDPAKVDSFYINHAHSDPLEWLLETGLPGLLLLVALLAWWATQAVRLWRSEQKDGVALAATIASAAILGHSLVDYPLRDASIQAIFALCLAFMAEPRSRKAASVPSDGAPERAPRHLVLTDDGFVSA